MSTSTAERLGLIVAPRRLVGRRRMVVGLVVLIGVAVLAVLAVATQRPSGYLDPEDTGRVGTRALVEVLRQHGVEVHVVRSIQDLAHEHLGTGTTIVVGDPLYLGAGAAGMLPDMTLATDRLVLLSPTDPQLAAMGIPLVTSGAGSPPLTAHCDSDIARSSDTVPGTDMRYVNRPERGSGEVALCFPLPAPDAKPGSPPGSGFPHGAAMAEVSRTPQHTDVVAIGFGSLFGNGAITEDSAAGIAVRALGRSPTLIWYQPGVSDLTVGNAGPAGSPWPRWLGPGAAVLMAAIVVLAAVRGRRFGRLVPEQLPVVVRAVETTESRGRLYRKAGDRDRSAAVLRDATVRRLGRRLALPATTPAGVLVAVAAGATGIPADQVGEALFGPAPADDPGLLRLAQRLADLEERARRS